MFSVFVDVDGHNRGPTSRSVVGNKIQTNSNFKAHMRHYSCFLDFIRRRCHIGSLFEFSNSHLVCYHRYIDMLNDLNRFVHKDISHYETSSGSSTRLCSTTAGVVRLVLIRRNLKGKRKEDRMKQIRFFRIFGVYLFKLINTK